MPEDKKLPDDNVTGKAGETGGQPAVDYESQIKALKEENEKFKKTASKNASEASDFKKRWQETLSETEKAKLEKQSLIEERNGFEKKLKVLDLTSKYTGLGYETKEAEKIAEAYVSGDTSTVFEMQEAFIRKIKDSKIEDRVRKVPTPTGGTGDKNITQDVFNKMNYEERVDLFNKDPNLYHKLITNASKKRLF